MKTLTRRIAHTCFGYIENDRLEYISRMYTIDEMVLDYFRDPSTWHDLKDILIYHPDPIVRHEASFIVGELEIEDLASFLSKVIKFDTSIVAKHEAAEALGKAKGREAMQAYIFLSKITSEQGYDDDVYHPDVQHTATQSMQRLRKEILMWGIRQGRK